MSADFDREFYCAKWWRVLPLAPDGIQPYVRTGRASQRLRPPAALARLVAAWGAIGYGRFAAIALTKRLISAALGRAPTSRVLRFGSPNGAPAACCLPPAQRSLAPARVRPARKN